MKMKVSKSKKEYIVALNNKRSIRALIAAIIVSLSTFICVVISVISLGEKESAFHYFTNLSNLLSATGALLMLPYAVEGIRKKRFTMPRWVSLFQYAGAVSVFITMTCACTIIYAAKGAAFAFGKHQLWLHLIIPILAIVLFLAVETGQYLTKKDSFIAQIPFWIYTLVYFVMVVLVGKDKGGWGDIYETNRFPRILVFIALFSIGYAVAIFLRFIHNKIVDRGLRQLTARWEEDADPVELRIEAYGLGRYMASRLDKSEIIIPMDLFQRMSEKCGVPIDDLTTAYTKGVLHGLQEK